MTIWRKQSAWFMLVAFLVLVLAACAPGAGSEDTSSESEGSDSEGSSESGGDGEISGNLKFSTSLEDMEIHGGRKLSVILKRNTLM